MLGILLQINTGSVAVTTTDTLQVAQTAVTNTLTAVTQQPITEDSFSLLTMVMKGGVIMIPLAIMFLLAIYIMVERFLTISRASKKSPGLINSIKDFVHKGNLDSAKAVCTSTNSPEAIMIEKGITRIGQPVNDIRDAMNESATVEIGRLEKHMSILNITGRIAPMFGFIGTIIGVIKIFYDIALAGTVEIEVISTGLYQKMITSCAGLVVGVFAFVGYHWLNARIDKLAHRMEESRMNFLDMLNEPTK